MIIAALFDCGKTFLAHNTINKKIIDIDEILENDHKIKSLNNREKETYIYNKILEYYKTYDIILIHINKITINVLQKNKIPYILCYPNNTEECYNEWIKRDKERNKKWKWYAPFHSFSKLITMLKKDNHALFHYTINENQYLSDVIDNITKIYVNYINKT